MVYSAPRLYADGLLVRGIDTLQADTSYLDVCTSVAIELYHEQAYAQPFTLSSPFRPGFISQVNGWLSWLSDPANYSRVTTPPRPMRWVARLRGGMWMDQAAKDGSGGSVRFCTSNGWSDAVMGPKQGAALTGADYPTGTYEVVGGAFQYWSSTWADQVYTKWLTDFGNQWGNHALLAEVDICKSATQFQEGMLQQFGIQRNLDDFLARGWTSAKHLQAFRESFDSAMSILALPYGVGLATSYNARGLVVVGPPAKYQAGAVQGLTDATDTIDAQVIRETSFALPMNKSFDASYVETGARSNEQALWDHLSGPPSRSDTGVRAQVPYQTSTLTKHDSAGIGVRDTIQAGILAGALRLEIPNGCHKASRGADQITPAYAATYAPQLTYHPERMSTMPGAPTLVGAVSDGTGTASTNVVQVTLPASIGTSCALLFFPCSGSSVSISSVTVDGTTITPTLLATAAGGSTLLGWAYVIQGQGGWSGKVLAVTFSANTKGALSAEVWRNVDAFGATGTGVVNNTGSGVTMATVTDKLGATVEALAGRLSTGAPTVTLPTGITVDSTYSTSTSSGYGVTQAVGNAAGTGGGSATSNADKVIGFTVSMAPTLQGSFDGATMSPPVVALQGTSPASGAFAATLGKPTVALAGTVVTPGVFGATTGKPAVALTSQTTSSGALAATMSSPVVQLAGTIVTAGQVVATMGSPTVALVGLVVTPGALSVTPSKPVVTLQGAGPASTSGAFAAVLGSPTVALTSQTTTPGALAAQPSAPVVSLAAQTTTSGAFAALGLPSPTVALQGRQITPGAFAGTMSKPTAALSSQTTTGGSFADSTLGSPTVALTGQIVTSGSLSATPSAPVVALSGQTPGTTGSFNVTPLAGPVVSLQGAVATLGSFDGAVMASPVVALQGVQSTSSVLAVTLPKPVVALTGLQVTPGSFAVNPSTGLGSPVVALAGQVATPGALTATLSKPTVQLTAVSPVVGAFAAMLGSPVVKLVAPRDGSPDPLEVGAWLNPTGTTRRASITAGV